VAAVGEAEKEERLIHSDTTPTCSATLQNPSAPSRFKINAMATVSRCFTIHLQYSDWHFFSHSGQ
jgi:hypothetical protein